MEPPYKKFLVIGNNPDEIVKAFDGDTIVEPYIAYDYGKKEIYRQNEIKCLTALLKEKLPEGFHESYEHDLEEILKQSDEEFYANLAYGKTVDENLNVISDKNPDAKFVNAKIADVSNAYPFILKDGTEVFSAKVGDIDWDAMAKNAPVYKRAWELIVKNDKPKEKWEEIAKTYGPSREELLRVFRTCENYVTFNTGFFTPYVALLRKGNFEWDVWNPDKQVEWAASFYKKYLDNLSDDTLLTLYATQEIF